MKSEYLSVFSPNAGKYGPEKLREYGTFGKALSEIFDQPLSSEQLSQNNQNSPWKISKESSLLTGIIGQQFTILFASFTKMSFTKDLLLEIFRNSEAATRGVL